MQREWTRLGTVSFLILVLCVPAGEALAQDETFGRTFGSIYLSAMEDARVGVVDAAPFEPFTFYIVASVDYGDIGRGDVNDTNGINAWEGSVSIPPEVIITNAVLNPTNALNLGSDRNWIVGLGVLNPFSGSESPHRLVTYSAILTQSPAPVDLVLDLGPADRTSFPHQPGPGWLDGIRIGECFLPDGSPAVCKRLFANTYGLRINCVTDCTVKTESTTWGTVKANFGG